MKKLPHNKISLLQSRCLAECSKLLEINKLHSKWNYKATVEIPCGAQVQWMLMKFEYDNSVRNSCLSWWAKKSDDEGNLCLFDDRKSCVMKKPQQWWQSQMTCMSTATCRDYDTTGSSTGPADGGKQEPLRMVMIVAHFTDQTNLLKWDGLILT